MCLKFKNHLPILRKYFLLGFIINLELVWDMQWNSSPISCLSIWKFNCHSTVTKEPAMQYSLHYQSSICLWVIFFRAQFVPLACLPGIVPGVCCLMSSGNLWSRSFYLYSCVMFGRHTCLCIFQKHFRM